VFRNGRAQISRYWEPDFTRREHDPRELAKQTVSSVSDAVGRVVSLPDLGCFLSGGLDSSTVCGLAARSRSETTRAFTIGFDVPEYDESRYARITANHFGSTCGNTAFTPVTSRGASTASSTASASHSATRPRCRPTCARTSPARPACATCSRATAATSSSEATSATRSSRCSTSTGTFRPGAPRRG